MQPGPEIKMTQPLEEQTETAAGSDHVEYASISLLSASHLTDDINQGAVPAMLPFLIASNHLTYAAAAGLMLAQSMSSSVVQPIFGLLADRRPAPWLIPLGLSIAGLGVALAGLAPTYPLMFAAIAASGLGVAAFHPEAARWTRYLGGSRQGTAMSLFSVGGNAGFAIGPLLITPVLAVFGPHGAVVLALPVLIMSFVIVFQRKRFTYSRGPAAGRGHGSIPIAAREQWREFTRLTGVVMVRSVVFFGLNTFIPLYWAHVLNQSNLRGGFALTTMLTASAFGTLAGGLMADRFGRRIVVVISMAALPLMMLALIGVDTVAAATAILIPLGFTMAAPSSVMVVMGQEYLPNRVGLAAGVTLGLSVTVGGLLMPLFGALADHHGLHFTLFVLSLIPAAGFLLSLTLPEPSENAFA
jgi:FSR family fosmidomycin resistance protein-like MFS transporter